MTPNSETVAKIKTAVYYVASQQFSQCPNTPWPSSYGSGVLPERLHFHIHVLGFCLLFLLYLFYNSQSVTFLSFPKTGRTIGCLCLVSTNNQMLFVYTTVIPLFSVCAEVGKMKAKNDYYCLQTIFFTNFIYLFISCHFRRCTIMRMLLVIKACET
jgi:hypothetical protein